jgi:hypothetical protein
MWYQFAEGQCEFPRNIDKYRYLTHGQSLGGVIVNVREMLQFEQLLDGLDRWDWEPTHQGMDLQMAGMNHYEAYVAALYNIEDITPINLTGKIDWNDEAQQVRSPNSEYGDGIVGYIRGEESDLSTGQFTTYKLSINVPKLLEIWKHLEEPNSMFLAADSRGLTQVYITQRAAIVLEVVGWSNISITSKLALNYPRGIS